MKNIYLAGFMGTGKSVLGKILAKKLNRDFIETDKLIEDKQGLKIADIFSQKGECYFRILEQKVISKLCFRESLVVSCGGGMICNQDNLDLLKSTGVVFSLKASASIIYQRIREDSHRPLLNVDNQLEKIKQLLKQRKYYYDQADYVIDTDNILPQDVADKIIRILNDAESS